MKKLVKENMLNEGFQNDLGKWMEKNDIYIDQGESIDMIYALCKKVYDLEKELYKRTPEKGVSNF